ncbi:sensor histidine kinase [Actinomadura sp. K4S16]|uniref:sensor histidine kinase n=1 Tax=Actinomadura sp. K4S16 TaxID=1316147 RepID=UPI0011EFA15F|nr:sensor histidine kinase [Actinomadura sp. K4S16]
MTPDGKERQTEPIVFYLERQHKKGGRPSLEHAGVTRNDLTDRSADSRRWHGRAGGLLSQVAAAVHAGTPEDDAEPASRPPLRTPEDNEAIELFDCVIGAVTRATVDADTDPAETARIMSLTARRLVRAVVDDLRLEAVTYVEALMDAVHAENLAERTRIARELHDHIGNGISGVYRQLDLFDIYRESNPARSAVVVERARRDVRGILERLQFLLSGLRLTETAQGLERALADYLDSVEEHEVATSLEFNGDESRINGHACEQLFLVIREAARNSFRHAAPSHISITVSITSDQVQAAVEDDGTGFDPSSSSRTANGLASMRERIEMLGGLLKTDSAPGQGTRVELLVPLRHEP